MTMVGTITKVEKKSFWPYEGPKITGKWIIPNFSSYARTYYYSNSNLLESPKFSIETGTGKLEGILKMSRDGGNINMSFYISYSNLPEIDCQISILNNKNQKFFTRSVNNRNNSARDFPFITWDYLEKERQTFLPNDTLTILCEFPISTDGINLQSDNIEIPKCCFQEEISKLFEEKKYCDAVILSANGEEFQVHKNILAVRSPVFAAMFEHDMLENKLNRVEIADVEYAVLKEMLRYIYTDKVQNLKTVAYDLLVAANKYELLRLKALCVEELSKSLTVNNVADILILSDLQGVDKLKMLATDFIIHHVKTVISSAGWKKMLTSYSYLADEIILRQNKFVVFK